MFVNKVSYEGKNIHTQHKLNIANKKESNSMTFTGISIVLAEKIQWKEQV